jgi:hypothetical protein
VSLQRHFDFLSKTWLFASESTSTSLDLLRTTTKQNDANTRL